MAFDREWHGLLAQESGAMLPEAMVDLIEGVVDNFHVKWRVTRHVHPFFINHGVGHGPKCIGPMDTHSFDPLGRNGSLFDKSPFRHG
jgi:hypothetical protein